MEKISVIVPCRNEEKYIVDFIESVIENNYPKEYLELFLIDGKSIDATMSILEKYKNNFDFIKTLTNENKTVPYALNLGIKAATGNYIVRLDAHCQIPENYFRDLIVWAKKLNTDNVGTIWITSVKNKTPKSNAIKKVLSNKFGVGNSYFRIGTDDIKEVDTVPFGCFKREVFDKVGLFNENLERDQDIELNKRIKRMGGRIFLIPNIYSIYFAREEYLPFAKNNYATGLWNVLTVFITKNYKSLSLRHFVPLMFLLSIILPLIISLWVPYIGLISGLSFLSYILLISIISSKINDRSTTFSNILFAFITLHFSYGFGSLIGLLRFDYLFKKR